MGRGSPTAFNNICSHRMQSACVSLLLTRRNLRWGQEPCQEAQVPPAGCKGAPLRAKPHSARSFASAPGRGRGTQAERLRSRRTATRSLHTTPFSSLVNPPKSKAQKVHRLGPAAIGSPRKVQRQANHFKTPPPQARTVTALC